MLWATGLSDLYPQPDMQLEERRDFGLCKAGLWEGGGLREGVAIQSERAQPPRPYHGAAEVELVTSSGEAKLCRDSRSKIINVHACYP